MWRAALERRLNAIWYEGARPWPGLALLSRLYGWLRQRRLRRAERSPAQSLAVPVIVVGDLTAGGSGKTPLVAAVVDHLRQQGRHPGVISRGYGRRGDALRRVQPDSSAIEVGDEPLLLQRRCGVPVAVAADRRLAAQALIEAGYDKLVVLAPRDTLLAVAEADVAEVTGMLEAAGEIVLSVGTIETGERGCTVRGAAGTWSAKGDWEATHLA